MDTFAPFASLRINGDIVSLDSPRLMGILNVTPDSFYENSRVDSGKSLLQVAGKMLEQGADFLDVGGYSSRPGADDISLEVELQRSIPAIRAILHEFPQARVSVDTFRSEVAIQAVDAGACMINDISGGSIDMTMIEAAARLGVPYVLMHMRGTPQNMTQQTDYQNLVKDINSYFAERVNALQEAGITDIIIDPGFGFAKNVEQNFELLGKLELLKPHRRPILVGLSRKSMIWRTLGTEPGYALNGTTALHMTALMKGANILRVHDVKEAREVVTLFNRLHKD